MNDLNNPLCGQHYNRLVDFAQELGITADQLQKLIRLVLNLTNARINAAKKHKSEEPLRLMNGTGL